MQEIVNLVSGWSGKKITARTIRYYIREGLLPPPAGGGKYARYTSQHFALLMKIRELQQDDGRLTLEQIRRELANRNPLEPLVTSLETYAKERRHKVGRKCQVEQGDFRIRITEGLYLAIDWESEFAVRDKLGEMDNENYLGRLERICDFIRDAIESGGVSDASL